MAHCMKHTKASCGHMFAHFDRKAEHISNENVDRSRSHLNYNLAVHQQMEQGEFVRQRCSEVRCQNRKDVNVMVSWIVTAPKDLPQQAEPAFFQAAYNFLENRYGHSNVVSAYVHMDEVTPHMHFAFVPVTEDRKRGGYKVSAKEVVNRRDLQTFHSDLSKYLEQQLGFPVNVLNEATKEGNRSIEQLKRQSATVQIATADVEAAQIVSNAREQVAGIETAYNAQKAFVARCEAASEPSSMYPDWAKKKTHLLGGQTVTVPQEKWEALHTAVQAPEYIKQAAQELDKSIDQAKAKAKDILSQATAEKNDTIAKAQDIVRQKDYILKEAQEMANSLQKQCDELQARKEQLEQELTQIEPYMESLEPLKAEVQELTKAKEILTGAVENEITQSKFYVPTKGFTSPDYYEEKARFENGKLLALYKNGEIRTVTRNIQGGYDYQILDDNRAGLCRIGWFKKEEKSTIPRSLLKELIAARDRDKPISDRLKRMIDQQNTTNRVIDKIKNRDDIER